MAILVTTREGTLMWGREKALLGDIYFGCRSPFFYFLFVIVVFIDGFSRFFLHELRINSFPIDTSSTYIEHVIAGLIRLMLNIGLFCWLPCFEIGIL